MKNLLFLLLLALPCLSFSQELDHTKILLIRHAQTINVLGNERVLSEEGEATAARWVSVFKDEPIEMIYSTDYKRTQATARPIATSKGGLSVISYDPGSFNLDNLLAEARGKTILIVGHSDTTPTIVNSLLGKNKYSTIKAGNHDNLYIVSYYSADQVSATLIHLK